MSTDPNRCGCCGFSPVDVTPEPWEYCDSSGRFAPESRSVNLCEVCRQTGLAHLWVWSRNAGLNQPGEFEIRRQSAWQTNYLAALIRGTRP